MKEAKQAKAEKHLDSPIRTSDTGITTIRAMVSSRIQNGGCVKACAVYDTAARKRVERKYHAMNRGFNVPWGNPNHPITIEAAALKSQLDADNFQTIEYRLYRGGGEETYSVISKTAYEYGIALTNGV